MSFVLDTSVTMTWCYEEEKTAYSDAVLDQLRGTEAHVPAIWPLEVSNALLVGERRNRISLVQTLRFLTLIETFPIRFDENGVHQALGPVLVLGREHNLTSYDASYLELAIRLGLPIASQDVRLREAATRVGVLLI